MIGFVKTIRHWYLVYSLAWWLGLAVMAGYTVVLGSLQGWEVVIWLNYFGEGPYELIGFLLALPGMMYFCYRVISYNQLWSVDAQ